jgi:hypothetical protein
MARGGVRPGSGRPKGAKNKVPALLKDAILQALSDADPEGSVAYLTKQAAANPTAFLTLVGKVLPMQITGADGGPVEHSITRVERVIVDPKN